MANLNTNGFRNNTVWLRISELQVVFIVYSNVIYLLWAFLYSNLPQTLSCLQ